MKIEIFLIRTNYTRWGVHGNLYINGKFLCNTCEHPSLHLPLGCHPISCKKGLVWIGRSKATRFECYNGPFTCVKGSINVGEYRTSGLLVHTQKYHSYICNRIKRFVNNKNKDVTITIKDQTA